MDIFGLVWICDVCILNKCYANGVHVIYVYVILIGYAHIICDVFVSSFLRFLVSSFLRFFVSSCPLAGSRSQVGGAVSLCFFMVLEYIFFDPLNIFF